MAHTKVNPSISDMENVKEHRDVYSNISETSLYQAFIGSTIYQTMKPLFISMKILGLFHSKEYRPSKSANKMYKPSPSLIYAIVVLLLLTFNFARSLSSFSDIGTFGPVLLFNIVTVSWYFLCLSNCITCFRACNIYDCLPMFCIVWDRIHKDDDTPYCLLFCRKRVIICTILSWIVALSNVGATGYLLYTTDIMNSILTPFSKSSSNYIGISVVAMVILLYLSASWVFPVALHLIISTILYTEFQRFNECLKNNIHSPTMPNTIEKVRQKHGKLCDLVEHADAFLAPYSGCLVVQSCVGICLLLYVSIWYEEARNTALSIMVMVFWMVSTIGNLAVLSLEGSYVNSQAHAAAKYLYEFPAANLTSDHSVQIFLFMSRLTGEPIGLSAMKMFVFDKPAILTIIGMLVTYFVLIIQFSPAFTSTNNSSCNCTELLSNATLQCTTL